MKNFIQISLFIMDCIYFICHIFYLKTSSKITQFNSTSTFFLDIYIIILLLLCALNSFNSTLFSSLISSNICMLVSIKGKAIFLILISQLLLIVFIFLLNWILLPILFFVIHSSNRSFLSSHFFRPILLDIQSPYLYPIFTLIRIFLKPFRFSR